MIPIEIADDICERGLKLYDEGLPRGSSTGWRGLDELYTIGVGQWTLITGIPHSGKSEWLDALMVNLAENDNWDFALYSPENYPTELHLAKLAEKRVRRPFGPGPTERMTREEFHLTSVWICDHFIWLAPEYKDHISLLEAAQVFGRNRTRKFGIVLDPWNALEHFRPKNLSETEYISMALTDITNWCRQKKCHVFVVAHPSKLPRGADEKRPVPTPYDIAGSAHWYNKADNIITVHRDQLDSHSQKVEIHIQKVRFKHMGRIGLAELMYDRVTGRYFERPPLHVVAQYVD